MSLENTVAKYEIQITRTGDGAAVSAQDFKQLQAVIDQANNSLLQHNNLQVKLVPAAKNSSTALHDLHSVSKLGSASLHELHAVALMLGVEAMPQLTGAVMGGNAALHALYYAGRAAEASLGLIVAALAGVAGAVATATTAWQAHEAELTRVKTSNDALSSLLANRQRMLEQIRQLRESEQIPQYTANYYTQILNNYKSMDDLLAHMRETSQDLRNLLPSHDQEEALKKISELTDNLIADTLEGYAKERFEISRTYNEKMKQMEALAKQAYPVGLLNMSSSIDKIEEQRAKVNKAYMMQMDALEERRAAKEREEAEKQELENEQFNREQANEAMKSLEDDLTLKALQSKEDRVTIARQEYEARKALYDQLLADGEIDEQKRTELLKQASIKRLDVERKTTSQMEQLSDRAMEYFASGLSQAFVDFASGAKSAQDAFSEFAASFMKQIADMILQMEILALLKSIFGASAGAAANGGTFDSADQPGWESSADFSPMALGGVRLAATGLAGFVSSPTYLPKFNVLAGEAGREMLTVLARPRMMQLGGVEAIVGQAGRRNLAVTDPDALAGSGGKAGGQLAITVSMEPGLRADIVGDSVQGATVNVVKLAQQNSPVRDAIRRASA